jgi:radical SAM superfamily enzyme YgiQ (UPF0313 family)
MLARDDFFNGHGRDTELVHSRRHCKVPGGEFGVEGRTTEMPHVAFVPFTGFRIREEKLLELGMTLPGLKQRANAVSELPALGLLTLAGMLPDHWTCSFHPAENWNDDLVERIVLEQPALVAVSALTASVNEAYAFSRRLKKENVPVVIGGLHVTTCPKESHQFCDAVVIGEGEPVWTQILNDAEHGTLQPEYIANKDSTAPLWPLPRFDLLDNPSRITIQTQRGCPLACDFCGASRLLGTFRQKPIENIRAELSATSHLFPNRLVELADDNTFVGRQDVGKFFEVLKEFNIRYFTEADWRIGERPEITTGLAQSGCVQILMGIESLVFRYPGMGAKDAELNRILEAVENIQSFGVAVNGCFIVGADGETFDSMNRLAEFILKSPFADVQITLQTPFPGTELYRRLKREDRILSERDWSYYTLFDVTYQPDCMSIDELEYGFEEILKRVFSEAETKRRNAIRREVWRNNPILHRYSNTSKE